MTQIFATRSAAVMRLSNRQDDAGAQDFVNSLALLGLLVFEDEERMRQDRRVPRYDQPNVSRETQGSARTLASLWSHRSTDDLQSRIFADLAEAGYTVTRKEPMTAP